MNKPALALVAVLALSVAYYAGTRSGSKPAPRALGQAAKAAATVYSCPMHPAYRSDRPGDCPMCGMRLEPVGLDDTGSAPSNAPGAVRLNSEKQQLIGVRMDEVDPASASQITLRVPGRIAVDDQRVYRITAAVDGWIRQLGPNPAGSFVRKQQVLATYYAPSLISAVQTYVFALQTNEHARTADATIGYQRGATQLSLQVALDSLRSLGMSEIQIQETAQTRVPPSDVRVYSPINGFVIARNLTPEQRFDKGTEMYRIADIGHVWVMAEVFEKDSGFLKPGTRATIVYQGQRFEGRMSPALPQFDPQTRTLKTRFEVDNPGDVLRPDMFVDVEIHVDMPAALTVPTDAVVDSGTRKTVFVDRGNGYFEPRRVETGWRIGDRVQVLKGLMAGERVVVSGNFLLDSESRMKSAALGIYNPETDPVCGMEVDHDAAKHAGRIVARDGSTYFFCSDDCRKRFEADPPRYLEGKAAPAPPKPRSGGAAAAPAVEKASRPAVAETAAVKDAVCGMDVNAKDAAAAGRSVRHAGKTYYFCSDECRKKFEANPGAFTK